MSKPKRLSLLEKKVRIWLIISTPSCIYDDFMDECNQIQKTKPKLVSEVKKVMFRLNSRTITRPLRKKDFAIFI